MIPATSIHFNDDGTAWVAVECPPDSAPAQWEQDDKPCDTCRNEQPGYEWSLGYNKTDCPDCINGRHTLTIEVACRTCNGLTVVPFIDRWGEEDGEDTCPAFEGCPSRTHRVSVVPGMVLRVCDPATGCPGPASPHICWSAVDRRVGSDTDGCWLLVTNTLHDASPSVALPPDAKPGMWAVKLEVHQ